MNSQLGRDANVSSWESAYQFVISLHLGSPLPLAFPTRLKIEKEILNWTMSMLKYSLHQFRSPALRLFDKSQDVLNTANACLETVHVSVD